MYKQCCWFEGSLDAKILLIGEAPGAFEEAYDRPFVGSSGDLLNRALGSAGISRHRDCCVTNVIRRRPPNNDLTPIIDLSKKSPVPSTEWLESVKALEELIDQSKANVIVPIGKAALYALTGRKEITKLRGSILSYKGRKLIPIIHPAAALREYIFSRFIFIDMHRIEEESHFPEIVLPERQYKIFPSYEETMLYLESIEHGMTIATDIECMLVGADNFELSHISFSKSPSEAISICFMKGNDPMFSAQEETDIMRKISAIMADDKIVKILQNAIFDFSFLFRKYGIVIRNIEDTMIAAAIAAPDFPKGLDFLTSIYTKEPYYKDEGKLHRRGQGSDESFALYSARDSVVLHEILEKLKIELVKLGNLNTYKNVCRLIEPLVYMQEKGMRVDLEALEKLKAMASDIIKEKTERLRALAGDLNPNSSKQLKDYFYYSRGRKPYISRTTHNDSVDKDALQKLAKGTSKYAPIEEAALILDIRFWEKRLSTYFNVKLSEGRFKMGFNPVGTRQGRLSSNANIFGEGTNSQNLPNEMKSILIPDEGYLLCEFDLSQAENRIVAYIAPEPKMIKAFEDYDAGTGYDVHTITASWIFGIPPSEVSREKGSDPLGDPRLSCRDRGKQANHALNYKMQASSFAALYKIDLAVAERIVSTYHAVYSGIRDWHAKIDMQLSTTRRLTNLLGRTYLFLDRWSTEMQRQAYSYIPQSTVPDIINHYGINTIYYDEAFQPIELLNQVHDAIVFQVPLSLGSKKIYDLLLKVKQALEIRLFANNYTFKIPADCKVGIKSLKETTALKLDNSPDDIAKLEDLNETNLR